MKSNKEIKSHWKSHPAPSIISGLNHKAMTINNQIETHQRCYNMHGTSRLIIYSAHDDNLDLQLRESRQRISSWIQRKATAPHYTTGLLLSIFKNPVGNLVQGFKGSSRNRVQIGFWLDPASHFDPSRVEAETWNWVRCATSHFPPFLSTPLPHLLPLVLMVTSYQAHQFRFKFD